MDWNSRRITAILENALLEDRATRDATSYACIDPNQRATATIIAKEDCILAGIGCVGRILDVYSALDGAVTAHYEVTTHPEIFDGVRLHKGRSVAVIPPISQRLEMHRIVEFAESGRWVPFDPSSLHPDIPTRPWHNIISGLPVALK